MLNFSQGPASALYGVVNIRLSATGKNAVEMESIVGMDSDSESRRIMSTLTGRNEMGEAHFSLRF